MDQHRILESRKSRVFRDKSGIRSAGMGHLDLYLTLPYPYERKVLKLAAYATIVPNRSTEDSSGAHQLEYGGAGRIGTESLQLWNHLTGNCHSVKNLS